MADHDYRKEQSAVRNQGDRPTCVGFAVSAAHEWMSDRRHVLSPEDAIWAGHQIGGPPAEPSTSVHWALTGLAKHGHASEKAWPYGAPEWPAPRPGAASYKANQSVLPGWRLIPGMTVTEIEGELKAGFAVALTIGFVFVAWRSADGLIDAPPGKRTQGNHAVLIVGSQTDSSGERSLLFKNSWGKAWGDNGYGTFTNRYVNAYAVQVHVLET